MARWRWLSLGTIGTAIGVVGFGAAAAYVVSVSLAPGGQSAPPVSAPRSPAAAANDARAAYQRGDYARALQLWSRAAENGDGAAQAGLGDLYRLGLGVAQDLALAVHWYGRAAGQNLPEAQYQLGLLVTEGAGGARLNTDEGLYWIKNAALRGQVEAQFRVGQAHEAGKFGALRVDLVEAAAWYGLAAGNGHPAAAAAAANAKAALSERQLISYEQRERELREAQVRR
jgi:TPR repeat protein